MKTPIQSLIYKMAGLLQVTCTGVICCLLQLKVHVSTLPSIDERIKCNTKKYTITKKIFYRLHTLPSSERYSSCTFGG